MVVSRKGAGKEIVEAIENAKKRIWVCSPFISSRYANILVRKALAGVDVKVVTSPKNDSEVFDILKRINVRVSYEVFVHAKMYIIDDVAYTGSMNLTVSGVEKNVEIIQRHENEGVKKLEEEFIKIWEISKDIPKENLKEFDPRFLDTLLLNAVADFFKGKRTWGVKWELKFDGCLGIIIDERSGLLICHSLDNLYCISAKNGEILWSIPMPIRLSLTKSFMKVYTNYVLLYSYYEVQKYRGRQNDREKDCVRVCLIDKKDGSVICRFEYCSKLLLRTFLDEDNRAIGILEYDPIEKRYKIVGFDFNGKMLDNYAGNSKIRLNIKYDTPPRKIAKIDVVCGDANNLYEIKGNFDLYTLNEKIDRLILVEKPERENYVYIYIYEYSSGKLLDKIEVLVGNIPRNGLVDVAIDNDGAVFLLTWTELYVIRSKDSVAKLKIVDRGKPIVEPPKTHVETFEYVAAPSIEYVYRHTVVECNKVVLTGDYIIISVLETHHYTDLKYGSYKLKKHNSHVFIYSKTGEFVFRFPCLKVPEIVPYDDGVIIYDGRLIYFYREALDLSPVADFLICLSEACSIISIDKNQYLKKMKRLYEDKLFIDVVKYAEKSLKEIKSKIREFKDNLRIECETILQRLNKFKEEGFKVDDLIEFTNEILDTIRDENIIEAKDKLEYLQNYLNKIFSEKPSVEIEIKEIEPKIIIVNKWVKIVLQIKAGSDYGVIVQNIEVIGDVKPLFERKSIPICPENEIEINIKPLINGQLPILIRITCKYFDKLYEFEKMIKLDVKGNNYL